MSNLSTSEKSANEDSSRRITKIIENQQQRKNLISPIVEVHSCDKCTYKVALEVRLIQHKISVHQQFFSQSKLSKSTATIKPANKTSITRMSRTVIPNQPSNLSGTNEKIGKTGRSGIDISKLTTLSKSLSANPISLPMGKPSASNAIVSRIMIGQNPSSTIISPNAIKNINGLQKSSVGTSKEKTIITVGNPSGKTSALARKLSNGLLKNNNNNKSRDSISNEGSSIITVGNNCSFKCGPCNFSANDKDCLVKHITSLHKGKPVY